VSGLISSAKITSVFPPDLSLPNSSLKSINLIPAYTEVAKRLGILHEQSNLSAVNVTKLRSVKKRK